MAGTAVCGVSVGAFATETAKWGAHVDVEGKFGTDRNLGEVDLFLPLRQNDRTLFFSNIRARADNEGSHEGNFGLGLRHMLPSGWNVGGYAYYDRRRTDFDNIFEQATLGVEALGRDFDFRVNAYLPFGDRVQHISSTPGGGSFASLVGTTIEVTTLGGFTHEERALRGFDAEIGWRVPLWSADADKALRLYAGIFHFDDSTVEPVTGPRLRAELTMYDLPSLPEASRLTLGAEYQDDDVRGSQGFAMARLRIPLQAEQRTGPSLHWQARRMTDYVVRDVDIVTGTQTTQAATIVEAATQTADGTSINVIDSAATTGAGLQAAVTNAGANSVVILSGTFSTTTATSLQAGQTMMGKGIIAVKTPSGHTAALATPGATINASTASNSIGAVAMANGSTLRGMTITQTQNPANVDPRGVDVVGVSDVTIVDNIVSVISTNGNAFGAFIIDSSNVVVTGNTISTSRPGATAVGLYANNSSLTVAGNDLSAFGNTTFAAYLVSNPGDLLAILPNSDGNVFTQGTCGTVGSGTFTGSFGYTSGGVPGSCP
ncbi:hypothetical protein W911_07750 [Hyphomicrobium nitrativorans NL23]|uniref:Inverse autotransporter beta-domain domain-containing protein n=2 Tax=Hyphomicrobium TaxID=81 RepID=V5SBR3_9HYPH|nr:hypothetical protein W911_07750 [Hyphomicrobium nitrativorans NL23]